MRKVMIKLLLSFGIILIAIQSYAIGIGVHFASGAVLHRGYGNNKVCDYPSFGGGFIVDTVVAKNDLFNYRMQLDYINYMRDVNHDIFKKNDNLDIVSVQNSFGFGIVRQTRFRYWIGPHVQLMYFIELKRISMNIGLVMGLNFHIGEISTFSIDFGTRGMYGSRSDQSNIKNPIRIEPFANLNFIFRIGDNFSSTKDKNEIKKEGDIIM